MVAAMDGLRKQPTRAGSAVADVWWGCAVHAGKPALMPGGCWAVIVVCVAVTVVP